MEVLSVWHWQTSIGTAWSTFRQARYSFFLPFLFTLYNIEVKEINTVIAPLLEQTQSCSLSRRYPFPVEQVR